MKKLRRFLTKQGRRKGVLYNTIVGSVFVRQYLIIFAFGMLFVNFCNGQTNYSVTFPESLKKSVVYFSPYTIFGVTPVAWGILKIDEPFDSIRSEELWEYDLQTPYDKYIPDSLRYDHRNQKGLKIIVDTAQEICQNQIFFNTYKYDSMYASPRYLTVKDKKGYRKMSLNQTKTLLIAATPVYIVNTTAENKYFYVRHSVVNITQEILDPNGNWKEIEMYEGGTYGMGGWGWKTLPPKSMLVTSILKYVGEYKTIARVKFYNGSVYYSSPYAITVNPKIFSGKIRTTLLDGFIMELK